MSDLQKASHYRSFYETAKKIKDPLVRVAFYDAIDAYRFDGIEPQDLPFEADLAFTAIRSFIDADCGRKCGGAPKGNQNARKHKTTEKQPKNNLENNYQNNIETNNDNVNDNDKENVDEDVEVSVNDYESVDDNVSEEREFISPKPVLDFNIPQNYAKQVFDILSENQLPCCFNNFITFMQTDFKRALETLHGPELKGFHSDMILGALKNYAQVVNNPNTWQGWKNKKSFDRFVSWDRFWDFLPDRFCLDNFLDRSAVPPPKQQNKGVGLNRALEILEEVQNEKKRVHG